ncbi:MAG: family 16 glycosylhydrolase [Myxococcota bacterium]|nr:family 16 glycosylhydrolase [Myxococcota bacterium]
MRRNAPMHIALATALVVACSAGDSIVIDSAEGEEETDTDSDTDTEPDTDTDSSSTPDTAADTDPEPDPPSNLLANPGFEEEESPWSIWGGASRVEGQALSGDWSLMATERNGAEQVVVGLEPNRVYRLSGWGMTTGADPLLIGVKDYGGEEMRVFFEESTYREGSLSFTTGFTNTTAVIYAYKHSGSEPGYADDLVLVDEGPSDRLLVWSDEFDGEGALDGSKWTYESGFVRNEEVQWYQSENAFQEGGVLVIEGRSETRPNPNYVSGSSDWRTSRETITHTSASVTTKDRYSWQYGHLVVRAKVTNLEGTWPAIWTLGIDCEWPSNGEVDVMENYGGDILANFAWGTDTRWKPYWDATRWSVVDWGEGWTDAFHIWEWEWNEEQMIIRLDGQVLNEASLATTLNGSAACAGQNPFQQPHRLLLNLALGGGAGGSIENLVFPTRYLVDYVRIYQ